MNFLLPIYIWPIPRLLMQKAEVTVLELDDETQRNPGQRITHNEAPADGGSPHARDAPTEPCSGAGTSEEGGSEPAGAGAGQAEAEGFSPAAVALNAPMHGESGRTISPAKPLDNSIAVGAAPRTAPAPVEHGMMTSKVLLHARGERDPAKPPRMNRWARKCQTMREAPGAVKHTLDLVGVSH